MKLIVGLGNPGARYKDTRHNFGFMITTQLARDLSSESWHSLDKFAASITEAQLPRDANQSLERILFAQPQTFMNLSGESVQKLTHFYQIDPSNVWVVYDELNVAFGKLRLRTGGTSGGHQGVQSIIDHIGPDFVRVRLGISLNDRSHEPAEAYVLQPFNTTEKEQLPHVISTATNIISQHIAGGSPLAETTYDLLKLS